MWRKTFPRSANTLAPFQDGFERTDEAFILVAAPHSHADESAVRQTLKRSAVSDEHAMIGDQSRAHTCGRRRRGGKAEPHEIRCGRVEGESRRAPRPSHPSA